MPVEPIHRPCPVCLSGQARLCMRVKEDRFGEAWEGPLVECLECGCWYLSEAPDAQSLGDFYRRCYGHYEALLGPGQVNYKWLLDRLGLKHLLRSGEPSLTSTRGIRGPRVLDFGCHDGALLRALEKTGLEVIGYEPHPTPEMQHPGILTGSLEALAGALPPVDDIVLSHVLEHLMEPRETLRILVGLLRPGGRLHLRIPNLDSPWRGFAGPAWIHWHPPFHLQHFDLRHLDRLAAELGLERIAMRNTTPTDWLMGNLRAKWRPAKALPNKDFHRPYATEIYLALRLLNLCVAPFAGGDLLETIYRLKEPVHGR